MGNDELVDDISLNALLCMCGSSQSLQLLVHLYTPRYLETIGDHDLISCPRSNVRQELLECVHTDARLWSARRIHASSDTISSRRLFPNRLEKQVIYRPTLILAKASSELEIPDRSSLRKRLERRGYPSSKPLAFSDDCLVGNDREFSERNKKEFLEVGDILDAGIRGIRVSGVSQGAKVVPHETERLFC